MTTDDSICLCGHMLRQHKRMEHSEETKRRLGEALEKINAQHLKPDAHNAALAEALFSVRSEMGDGYQVERVGSCQVERVGSCQPCDEKRRPCYSFHLDDSPIGAAVTLLRAELSAALLAKDEAEAQRDAFGQKAVQLQDRLKLAEAVADVAQNLYIAKTRGRLEANKDRWAELGRAIEAWDPHPLDAMDDFAELMKGALADPEVRCAYKENGLRRRLAREFEHARKERGLTVRELAKTIGTSPSQVQRLLHHEVGGSLTLSTIVRAADALDLTVTMWARPS